MANSNLNTKIKEIRRREKAQRKREARLAKQQAKRKEHDGDDSKAKGVTVTKRVLATVVGRI